MLRDYLALMRMLKAKRLRVALDTAVLVAALGGLKVLIDVVSWEFIALNPLFTSVVAGGFFVIGLIVAGTLGDYKEAEKMPADITGALENIYQDFRFISRTLPGVDLALLRQRLLAIVSTLKADLVTPDGRDCLGAVGEVSESILYLETLGSPANYVVRLRAEQGSIRRNVLRIYHIERIRFLPSAEVLIRTVVALIITTLEFTQLSSLAQEVVVVVLISYFFLYLVRLLRLLDTPFREDGKTMDDVSLFLLNEFSRRLTADAAAAPSGGVTPEAR